MSLGLVNVAPSRSNASSLRPASLAGDGVTLSSSGVKPNSTVTVYKDGTTAGTVTANSSGVWTYVFGTAPASNAVLSYDGVVVGPTTTVSPPVSQSSGSVPVLVTAPTISGTAGVGNVLTLVHGSYTNGPITSYNLSWLRNGSAIGVITTTYTQVSADQGTTITCAEVPINAAGNGPRTVTSNSIVVPAAPSSGGTLDFSDPNNSGLQPGL